MRSLVIVDLLSSSTLCRQTGRAAHSAMPEANYNATLASRVGWEDEEVPLLTVSVQRNRASSTPLTCFSARVAELDLMAEITKKVSHVLPRISFHVSYVD
jgi:hypothetical protein